jgi:predicted GTPase
VALLGTTGAEKSQLCNFIMHYKANTTFKVSDSFNSETQKSQSKECNSSGINLDIIDTTGCCYSVGKNNGNFKVLIDFFKRKKINFFISNSNSNFFYQKT